MLNVIVAAGSLDDQRVFEELRQSDTAFGRKGMPLGENSTQGIAQQWIKGQNICHDGGSKTAIYLTVNDPVPDFIVIAIKDLYIHLWIIFPGKIHAQC